MQRMTLRRQSLGFTMLEILISLFLIAIGLLGMLGLQAQATVAEFESYQRGQALILVQDMVDRINANRGAGGCYVVTTDAANGSPQLGAGNAPTVCTGGFGTTVTRAMANKDLADWDNALKGASEKKGGTNVGGLLGARGCVSQDAVTGNYRVAIAWQGMSPTVAPTAVDANATCGLNQYGNEAARREVNITFRIADLDGV
jgi:type IV pilus assembly protein PilV